MRNASILAVLAVLFAPGIGAAQEASRIEITGYYSYFRFNPENSGTFNSHSLNGGGGEIGFFFNSMFGIKGEFAGYQSSTVGFSNGFSSASASANLFTYNFGPVVKFRSERWEPFGEALFGGAHSNFYGNLCRQLMTCIVNNPSNNAFDFIIGGGLDIPVSHHVSLRPVQADYVLTRFGNGFTQGHQNQSNFRYQAGLQVRF